MKNHTQTGLASKHLSIPEKIQHHAEKNPLEKICNPQDIADAAVCLLTEKSSWVTGQVLKVDGGYGRIK